MLEFRALTKRFGGVTAVDGVDLAIRRGEFVTFLGPSGSGKTTMLRLLAGFELPSSGSISIDGRDVSRLRPADRGIGMVFQQYALFPHLTVAGNVAYGLRMRRWERRRRDERVEEMLRVVRLEGYGERYARQLSGGQQQRVALARALAFGPSVLLMDEPLGALDRRLRQDMETEFRRIHRELEPTIVYVTHDQEEALALSDRIAIVRDGRVLAFGAPRDLLARPTSAFVASFFSGANLLAAADVQADGDGYASATCLGQRLRLPVGGALGGPMRLAVVPNDLRRGADGPALDVAGTVTDLSLLSDVVRVKLDVPGEGGVIARLPPRECADLEVGGSLTLRVACGDATLVPDDGG
ncbi:ABC transporter ATP-binding protein [Conexibacter woesei]|uniref:ABC-type quaternary amine transporter n=1 Tax=Conexibacter woesei (strain DSM 14684 / CCUG 47730 / CIP 108061 / JCM 11494 / NBRC 100937 / ID131577) TaxID=469383 RepID=D3F2L3_CONWI|nr:ABC transporter ATP-binding protein [Conexibacter woesei]ADB52279.1 ABC transporter related protein [Conexibacter woesei DSM 14684]